MTLLNIVYDTSITKWQKACDNYFIILNYLVIMVLHVYKFDIWKYRNCGPFL